MNTISYNFACNLLDSAGFPNSEIKCSNGTTGKTTASAIFVKRSKPFVTFSFYPNESGLFNANEINTFIEKWNNP